MGDTDQAHAREDRLFGGLFGAGMALVVSWVIWLVQPPVALGEFRLPDAILFVFLATIAGGASGCLLGHRAVGSVWAVRSTIEMASLTYAIGLLFGPVFFVLSPWGGLLLAVTPLLFLIYLPLALMLLVPAATWVVAMRFLFAESLVADEDPELAA